MRLLSNPNSIRSLCSKTYHKTPRYCRNFSKPTWSGPLADPLPSNVVPPQGWTPTPYVTETIGGAWHTYDIFSRLLKERIICVNGEIERQSSGTIVAQLLFLEAENPGKPIHMYINSPGGSVTAGLAIYDTMMYIHPKVSTICMGQAASMGSLILCGGAPGERYALPHATIMVHQPSGGYSGQASDLAIHANEIVRVRKMVNEIYRRHMTKPHTLDELENLMDRDRFMSAEEALGMGMIDGILEKRPGHAKEP